MSTRGLRNNNPGNIRISDERFDGEIQPSQDKSFKQFSSMAHGYRAMFVILSSYLAKGHNTLEKIIGRWAPISENPTRAYVSVVHRLSEVPKDKELTAKSGEDYIKIVAAMSYVENATKAVMGEVESGFNLQTKITK